MNTLYFFPSLPSVCEMDFFFLLFVVILISSWLCDAVVLLNYILLDNIEEVAVN